MKLIKKLKNISAEDRRDLWRNIRGRYQLFKVLFKWDRVYRREIIVTLLALVLVNYSILDMDSPYDYVALMIEGLILWIQMGNDYSILPREYRPSQNGVRFSTSTSTSVTFENESIKFNQINPPKAEKKLKMYNPFLDQNAHKETPLCSDRLNDHLMSVPSLPYQICENEREYISSVNQIRYLAIRVANKKQHTTNGEKLSLYGSAADLMEKSPVPVSGTTYFEALLTAEAYRSQIVRINLRGVNEVNSDLTQYYPFEATRHKGKNQLSLADDYYRRVAGHIGTTSIFFTENRKILMLYQGAGKAMEANKIHLGGSGSMEFSDAVQHPELDLRDAVRSCMARETSEETGMIDQFDTVYKNTIVTGFFHWMDRSGKPEFTGITKASDDFLAKNCNLDGDEIVKSEEIPILINELSDFNGVLDYAIKHKLNLSLSSLMALHRMSVIATYGNNKASAKQKRIFKDMNAFLFSA